ncbi:MAG: hypothetical protein HKL80_12005, partial [Acidimicrobiales bacterium]|nr:hypothetical protein [Acidimicrobiales bacterium]
MQDVKCFSNKVRVDVSKFKLFSKAIVSIFLATVLVGCGSSSKPVNSPAVNPATSTSISSSAQSLDGLTLETLGAPTNYDGGQTDNTQTIETYTEHSPNDWEM